MQYLPAILLFIACILTLFASIMWQPDIRRKRVLKWSAAAYIFAVVFAVLYLYFS